MVNKAKTWYREPSERTKARARHRILRRNLRVPFFRELIRRTMMARLAIYAGTGAPDQTYTGTLRREYYPEPVIRRD